VNGKAHTVPERLHTIADVVDLAYGPNPEQSSTEAVAVTARERGMESARIVSPDEKIDVHDGLILNVVKADGQASH
jgi:hypothetical protein